MITAKNFTIQDQTIGVFKSGLAASNRLRHVV
jgi:hypothetical protein